MGLFSFFCKKKDTKKDVVAETPKVAPAPTTQTPATEIKTSPATQSASQSTPPKTTVSFKIDSKDCTGKIGQLLLDAAAENGVYIPSLCHMKGVHAAGSCRICTVKVNGRAMASCTTPLDNNSEGWNVESNSPDILELRKTVIELLFVEGNHFCPSCEKSGDCELQALAYKYQMMVPKFPYTFPKREPDATAPFVYLDRNRCIYCKKCIRSVQVDGKNVFAFKNRGHHLTIAIDKVLAAKMTAELAQKAMDSCPVGAILKKEIGFVRPIGTRKFDKKPIGSNIQN